jgi:hypothetical protein
MSRATLLVIAAFTASVVHVRMARADKADVPGLIAVIQQQPADMDRSTWKEHRRDAAKKLAQSKDKRALPVLIQLAETETFDIIGEIAIEGLGTLGDPGAVPTLQKIAADPSRDRSQRELAKKALAKLGASETSPAPAPRPTPAPAPTPTPTPAPRPTPAPTPTPTPAPAPLPPSTSPSEPAAAPPSGEVRASAATSAPSESLLGDSHAAAGIPALPDLSDDTLAAYERVTLAAGNASMSYDTLAKRFDFSGDVAGSYARRVERTGFAWGVDANVSVVTGLVNQSAIAAQGINQSQTRGAEVVASGDAEVRYYHGQLYAVGKTVLALQEDYASDAEPGGTNHLTTTDADLQIAVGGGWGRVLDVGAAIRVRRIARTLDAARALGKPIDAATAKKLQQAWWALRGERTTYRALIVTVAILREAGVLLTEPDPGLSYELLNVLRDSWLYVRPSGADIQVAFGEGYLVRPSTTNNAMYDATSENGHVEQVLGLASYGQQVDDDKLEIIGTAFAQARLFAPMPQGSPWAVGGSGTLNRYTYSDHGDPFGLLSLTAVIGLSNDGLMGSSTSLHVEGDLGFTYWINQASGLTLAGSIIMDGNALFVGASLKATYGLLDGSFAR